MTKDELLKRFCCLISLVGGDAFDHKYACDCFCDTGVFANGPHYRTDEEVMAFIEKAVVKAVAKHKRVSKTEVRAWLTIRQSS